MLLALAFSPVLAQTTPVPCSVAEHLDLDSYTLMAGYRSSELDNDEAAATYAGCLAAGLTRDLKAQPKLSARIAQLRTQYRQLRSLEGQLAYMMMGGGTMYTHAVPRSEPETEARLRALATLASSPLGGQTGARYSQELRLAREVFAERVAKLRAWKPDGSSSFDRATFTRLIQQYQQAGSTLMATLGQRGDAATAVGYQPLEWSLFVDEFLTESQPK